MQLPQQNEMPVPEALVYPPAEIERLQQLTALFRDWSKAMEDTCPGRPALARSLVSDGFYPHYFRQRIRILFIGREARGLAGATYIDILHDAYKKGIIGSQRVNSSFFHRRLLRVSFGLNTGMPEWSRIPCAAVIARDFGTACGISFAFMNISKCSNESKS